MSPSCRHRGVCRSRGDGWRLAPAVLQGCWASVSGRLVSSQSSTTSLALCPRSRARVPSQRSHLSWALCPTQLPQITTLSSLLCAPHRSAPCPLHTRGLSHLRSMCPCMETLVLSAEPQVPIKAKQSVPHTLQATLAALGILGRSLLLSPFLPRVLVLFFSEPGGSTSPFKLNTLEMGSLVAQASLKQTGFEL